MKFVDLETSRPPTGYICILALIGHKLSNNKMYPLSNDFKNSPCRSYMYLVINFVSNVAVMESNLNSLKLDHT